MAAGFGVVVNNISKIFDKKLMEVTAAAAQMSEQALKTFRSHQFASKHEPDGKAARETGVKKSEARKYVTAHQAAAAATTMGTAWINRSFRAARTVYADYGNDEEGVYFHLYHTMSYGAYLELGNNRKYAVLEPIVRGLAPEFLRRVKAIYGAG